MTINVARASPDISQPASGTFRPRRVHAVEVEPDVLIGLVLRTYDSKPDDDIGFHLSVFSFSVAKRTSAEIARSIGLSTAALAPHLKNLVALGYLERVFHGWVDLGECKWRGRPAPAEIGRELAARAPLYPAKCRTLRLIAFLRSTPKSFPANLTAYDLPCLYGEKPLSVPTP